jgi:serine/threonine protein kinase
MDYPCKGKTKEECESDANCQTRGKDCIRYKGVNAGKRYRYNNGKRVEIELANLNLTDNFEIKYDPELDPVRPVLTRRMLNSGTYGAGFIPAFPCVDGRVFPKSVGKVFWEAADQDEWNIIQDLTNIEKNQKQKYFTYTKDRCKIEFPKGNTQAELDLLDYLKKKKADTPQRNLDQFIMDYSGIRLKDYIQNYYSLNSISRGEFILILENAFYAIKRLIDHNYVHQDIKEDNIAISNTQRLRLIDFGLTLKFDDYYQQSKNLLLRVPYLSVAPPENYIFQTYQPVDLDTIANWLNDSAFYLGVIGPTPNLNTFLNDIKDINKNLIDKVKQVLLSNGVTETKIFLKCLEKDSYETFERTYPNVETVDILSEIKSEYTESFKKKMKYFKDQSFAKKSDLYSLGMIIFRNYEYLMSSSRDNQQIVPLFRELFRGLINPSPIDRIDINKAIELVKKIKEIHKNANGVDPFKSNVDPDSVKNVFLQFGKSKNEHEKTLKYLKDL